MYVTNPENVPHFGKKEKKPDNAGFWSIAWLLVRNQSSHRQFRAQRPARKMLSSHPLWADSPKNTSFQSAPPSH